MITVTAEQQRAHDALSALWSDPDIVGYSEYRAIFECVMEGTEGIADPVERREMQIAMLREIILCAGRQLRDIVAPGNTIEMREVRA